MEFVDENLDFKTGSRHLEIIHNTDIDWYNVFCKFSI